LLKKVKQVLISLLCVTLVENLLFVKKIRVNFIFVLVVLAMLALMVIQFFHTAQLYDRKSIQFKSKVNTSLERIAIRHEKAEDIRRYMHIVNRDFSGQYKDILKKEFQNLLSTRESISIRDTSVFENGEMQNYLIIRGKSFDSLSGLTAEHKVLARDVRQVRDLFRSQGKKIGKSDSVSVAVQLDQRVLKQIFKKAKFVNDMLVEAFRYNVYDEPEKRIDLDFLDSVIRYEFRTDDLPMDYKFMLTDEDGAPLLFQKEEIKNENKFRIIRYSTNLDTVNSAKIGLFPSNSLDDNVSLFIHFPSKRSFLLSEMWGSISISLMLMVLIVIALVFMFRTILTQKKLSELRSDFISNMTHEFKTPISTISLACQAMNDPEMMAGNIENGRPYVKMIEDENQRLSSLVERILQSALMDRGEVQLKKEMVTLNEIIHEVVHHARFRLKAGGGVIKVDIPTEMIQLEADKMHLTNVISNLVDNGIKYSSDVPDLSIHLKKEGDAYFLNVRDCGIGIEKEHIPKIFDKLYRVPTGNLHNVKGFGLGLSYVKAVVELHDWSVSVKSVLGKGSVFTVKISKRL
jgi:two-component system, OmpR family, phosphate regulon sensor histidine kinase PhoR